VRAICAFDTSDGWVETAYNTTFVSTNGTVVDLLSTQPITGAKLGDVREDISLELSFAIELGRTACEGFQVGGDQGAY